MGGFFSWTWKQYFLRRFEKIAHTAYNDKGVREAYDEYNKSTDELLSTLKGTSKMQRHLRSDKFKKAIDKPGKERSRAVTKALKDMGFDV